MRRGLTFDRRVLKVLRATAELEDQSLGDLLERIVADAFEGRVTFSHETLDRIDRFRDLYGLEMRAQPIDRHALKK